MSMDTNFKLTFSCPTREQLDHVLAYIQFKKERYDFWRGGGEITQLKQRVGTDSNAAVVSWGFDFEDNIYHNDEGYARVNATAWANENSWNVWISGSEGELVDLVRRFTFLEISGELETEYGHEETISLSGGDY